MGIDGFAGRALQNNGAAAREIFVEVIMPLENISFVVAWWLMAYVSQMRGLSVIIWILRNQKFASRQ